MNNNSWRISLRRSTSLHMLFITSICLILCSTAYGAHYNLVLDNPPLSPSFIMKIIGSIQINNQPPQMVIDGNPGDEIGVFYDGVLCGALAIDRSDGYYSINVFNRNCVDNGPLTGSVLTIVIWDASGSVEYSQEVDVGIVEEEVKDAQGRLIWKTGTWHVNLSVLIPVQVSSIQPESGDNATSTAVTISGEEFEPGAQARLGTYDLIDVAWIDAQTLTAKVPSGLPEGSYDLTVTNTDGRSADLPSAFEVTEAPQPVIYNVLPSEGENDGVVTINVIGSNFLSGLEVKLGDYVLENVIYYAEGYVTADVPVGLQPGYYDLIAINPGLKSGVKPNAFLVTQGGTPGIGLEFRSGLNGFGYPVQIPGTKTSFELMEDYFTPENSYNIQAYDHNSGQWMVSRWDENGDPNGIEFLINECEGYLFYAKEDIPSIYFSGDMPTCSLDLHKGLNAVSLSVPQGVVYTAYKLLRQLGDKEQVASASQYDQQRGRWDSAFWINNELGGVDFMIESGKSCLLSMKQEKTGWNPTW